MNISLSKPIVRADITEAKIIFAQIDLDADFNPVELKLQVDIGGKIEHINHTDPAEIAKFLSVVVANDCAAEVAGKINDKGEIV